MNAVNVNDVENISTSTPFITICGRSAESEQQIQTMQLGLLTQALRNSKQEAASQILSRVFQTMSISRILRIHPCILHYFAAGTGAAAGAVAAVA